MAVYGGQAHKGDRLAPYLLSLPIALLLGTIFMVPFLFLVIFSFWRFVPGSLIPERVFSIENYAKLFLDPYYSDVFFRTLRISVLATVVCAVAGFPVARTLSSMRSKWKGLLLALLLLPLVGGVMVQTMGWVALLLRYGALNGFLRTVGIISQPINFLGGEFAVVIGLVQGFLPFMVLPLITILTRLDPSMEEAASMLGANRLRTFFEVVLPLSSGGLTVGCLLVFTASLASFVTPSVLGQGKIQVFGTLAYQQAILVLNWPFASALAVLWITLFLGFGSLVKAASALRARTRLSKRLTLDQHIGG